MKTAKIETLDPAILPQFYTQNSQREQLLLDYSQEFETAFLTNFPNRKPLFLAPKNEGKTNKFISTYIKPTILPNSELSTAQNLANFVARTTNYEKLNNELLYPEYIQSPQTTFEWQSGDCFDLSILLVSLLIGAGYDAYVVVGYADRRLTNQETQRENCPEIPEFRDISDILSDYYATDITGSSLYKNQLLKVNHSYNKEIDDFTEVEKIFTKNSWILSNQVKPEKHLQNFYFRVNTNQYIQDKLQININLNHQMQLKNETGFSDFSLLFNQIDSKVAELRYSLSGDGNLRSEKLSTLGAAIIFDPNITMLKTSFLANKYLKTRPLIPVSEYQKIANLRLKCAKIGAAELDIENYILSYMQKNNKLDDILIPGKVGQKVKQQKEMEKRSEIELRNNRINELCSDQYENQRIYSWVYIAGEYEENLNTILNQLNTPQNVKNSVFIDPASGQFFNVRNQLFNGIESIFNHNNYYVNLQENNIQTLKFDFNNIENWCICLMTNQIVQMRQIQFNTVAKNKDLANAVGGVENQYLNEFGSAQSEIVNGVDLPDKVVSNQDKNLFEENVNNYVSQLNNNDVDVNELQSDFLAKKANQMQEKYKNRWDSVTPVKVLISSLPTPWPVSTNLSEIKIENNFPLRKALDSELIKNEFMPEKTILYKDCFVRLFNEFSQRTGVVAVVQSCPKPVYNTIIDEDGDILFKEISHYFITKLSLFKHREDGMDMRVQQFQIDKDEVYQQEIDDEFLKYNFNGEILSKLDTEIVEFNEVNYPIWCFVGQDLEELGEEAKLDKVKFESVYPINSKVTINRFIFNNTRPDCLKSHEVFENGTRKSLFYPKREDFMCCQVQKVNNQINQKFYDFLRLDGLKERIFNFNDEIDVENSIIIPMSTIVEGIFNSQDVNIKNLTEKFRDIGSIQKTIVNRRRRLIEGKNIILTAEAQFVAGLAEKEKEKEGDQENENETKQDGPKIAFIENEEKIVNQDTFQEIETSLTLSSYNIFVANKQLFNSNIASVFTPKYSIQQGVNSIIKRHEDLLLMAYNLCPDVIEKKEDKEEENTHMIIEDKENSNKSFTESEISVDHQGEMETGIGIEFWLKKRTQVLKQQDSKQTTKHLKNDLVDLFNQKSGMILPKGLASTDPSLNKLENIDSELRNFTDYFYDFYSIDQYGSGFNLIQYLKLLKRRELPILPVHDSGKLAQKYMEMNMRDPQRYEQIEYNFQENLIRTVEQPIYPEQQAVQKLFDKQNGMCHFNKVYNFVSSIITKQNIQLAQALNKKGIDTSINKSKIRQPLGSIAQNAANNKIFNAFQQLPLADSEPQTSILKVSEEFVFLSSREKVLHSAIYADFQSKIQVIDSIEQLQETKLPNPTKKGLKFTPRDLVAAKFALKNHGLETRFTMRITPLQTVENQQSGTDFLDIFIPKEFKTTQILPSAIAKKVLHDCMDSMRMRLVERSSIIQSRLEGETENLRRKKAVYNKSSEQLEVSDREKILSEIRDSIFRIEILELRLQKHAQESAVRYVELEKKVKEDARMAKWNSGDDVNEEE